MSTISCSVATDPPHWSENTHPMEHVEDGTRCSGLDNVLAHFGEVAHSEGASTKSKSARDLDLSLRARAHQDQYLTLVRWECALTPVSPVWFGVWGVFLHITRCQTAVLHEKQKQQSNLIGNQYMLFMDAAAAGSSMCRVQSYGKLDYPKWGISNEAISNQYSSSLPVGW